MRKVILKLAVIFVSLVILFFQHCVLSKVVIDLSNENLLTISSAERIIIFVNNFSLGILSFFYFIPIVFLVKFKNQDWKLFFLYEGVLLLFVVLEIFLFSYYFNYPTKM